MAKSRSELEVTRDLKFQNYVQCYTSSSMATPAKLPHTAPSTGSPSLYKTEPMDISLSNYTEMMCINIVTILCLISVA